MGKEKILWCFKALWCLCDATVTYWVVLHSEICVCAFFCVSTLCFTLPFCVLVLFDLCCTWENDIDRGLMSYIRQTLASEYSWENIDFDQILAGGWWAISNSCHLLQSSVERSLAEHWCCSSSSTNPLSMFDLHNCSTNDFSTELMATRVWSSSWTFCQCLISINCFTNDLSTELWSRWQQEFKVAHHVLPMFDQHLCSTNDLST